MSDRDDILARIRTSLDKNRGMLEELAAPALLPHPEGPFLRGETAPIDQFVAEIDALQAHPHRCTGVEAAREKMLDLVRGHNVDRVLRWGASDMPIPDLDATLVSNGIESADSRILASADRNAHLQGLDDVQICISGVDAAIAGSGTMVVVSGPGRGRLASLLPPIHIALLPADRIVRSLPDAWHLLTTTFGDDVATKHANISLITGPSRTGDIEQTLSLGVHGPKELHVIVIE